MLFGITILICVAGLAVILIMSASSRSKRKSSKHLEEEQVWNDTAFSNYQEVENLRSQNRELEEALDEERYFRQEDYRQFERERMELEIRQSILESQVKQNKYKWLTIRHVAIGVATLLVLLFTGELSAENIGKSGSIALLTAIISLLSSKD